MLNLPPRHASLSCRILVLSREQALKLPSQRERVSRSHQLTHFVEMLSKVQIPFQDAVRATKAQTPSWEYFRLLVNLHQVICNPLDGLVCWYAAGRFDVSLGWRIAALRCGEGSSVTVVDLLALATVGVSLVAGGRFERLMRRRAPGPFDVRLN